MNSIAIADLQKELFTPKNCPVQSRAHHLRAMTVLSPQVIVRTRKMLELDITILM
jgi:hypothetical protein